MGASLKREGRQLRLGDVKRPCAGGRTIDLPPAFLGLLREHRSSRVREWLVAGPAWIYGGYVFASKFRTPLDPANVRRLFRRIGEPAGIGAVVPYQLRHTAASLLLDNDATIEEVTPPRPEGRGFGGAAHATVLSTRPAGCCPAGATRFTEPPTPRGA